MKKLALAVLALAVLALSMLAGGYTAMLVTTI